MMKKGQSALEFLTTYGWAFLVILIMIGALSYFGVLDPARFLPDKCVMEAGINCDEMVIVTGTGDAGGAQFVATNNIGSAVTVTGTRITDVSGVDCSGGSIIETIDGDSGAWAQGSDIQYNITGCVVGAGDRPTFQIAIDFTKSGGSLNQSITGTVSGRAS